jgi:hypothetical protein
MIFLSAGLKYHDTAMRINNTDEEAISFMESPDAICENSAPDMAKKKPWFDTEDPDGNEMRWYQVLTSDTQVTGERQQP